MPQPRTKRAERRPYQSDILPTLEPFHRSSGALTENWQLSARHWLPPLGGRRPPVFNFSRDYRLLAPGYIGGDNRVSARPRPSVACVKKVSHARRIRSILATTAESAVPPLPTTKRNACR